MFNSYALAKVQKFYNENLVIKCCYLMTEIVEPCMKALPRKFDLYIEANKILNEMGCG